MKLKIILGDITDSNCDAIVNAANKELRCGSGVCGAIFKAAGHYDELQKECFSKSPIKTGEAVITNGYNLKAKYIIHAAGPVYSSYSDTKAEELLEKTYIFTLEIAEKYNLKSIAFPSISTGVYGYPIDKACKIALRAIKSFDYKSIDLVEIVCFDKNTYEIYLKNAQV